jgi:hypothetical protein
MTDKTHERSLDELASGLASGSLSRRKALRLVGGLLVGSALASIPGIAWAKGKPGGAKCKRDTQCASGQCVDGVCGGCARRCSEFTTPRGDFCFCADLVGGGQACVVSIGRFADSCNECIVSGSFVELCIDATVFGAPLGVACVEPCPQQA